jgi:chromosome segregation ATPase
MLHTGAHLMKDLATSSLVLTQHGGVLTPRSRPLKLKALDIEAEDEIGVVEKTQEKAEENKEEVSKLKKKAKALLAMVEKAQVEKEHRKKEFVQLRSETDNLHSEHTILQARHTWAKSSLDSAITAQDEYRKNYDHMEANVKKAKAQLENRVQTDPDFHLQELQHLEAENKANAQQFYTQREAVQQALDRFQCAHRDTARHVIESTAKGQAMELLRAVFLRWGSFIVDQISTREQADQLKVVTESVQSGKCQAQALATEVVGRATELHDFRLASFAAWSQQELPQEEPETAFHDGDVLSRLGYLMNLQHHGSILSRALKGWAAQATMGRATRAQEAAAQAKFAAFESTLTALQAELDEKDAEMADAQEEIQMICGKNKLLQVEVKDIMLITESIGDSLKEMEDLLLLEE